MFSPSSPAPSERVRLRRKPDRGHYDPETVHAILDAMPLCTVSQIVDGQPIGMPTVQWREGRHVYWHGSAAARMMKTGADAEVCLTVTILDGLVMARSAMHHSANYRSVMVMGRARAITDPAEKAAKLRAFIEVLSPGRWDRLRPMTEAELKATAVLSLSLDEASAKIRSGPPIDDDADLDTPVWAGVLPLRLTPGMPKPDAHCRPDVAPFDPTTGPSWG